MSSPPPSPRPRYADLHMHSTASDGAFAPAKLMEMAHARALAAVALTDHDTVAGLSDAASAADRLGMEFIPGIELEAMCGRHRLHILGYFIDAANPTLLALLKRMIDQRRARAAEILARLAAMGIQLDFAPLLDATTSSPIGRPHIAAALVRAGVVTHPQLAFKKFLAEGAPAYVPRQTPDVDEAIAALHTAGGLASLAHPSHVKYDSSLELETLLRRLQSAGLAALEVIHPDIAPAPRALFESLAAKLGLARTGGSDFHALARTQHRGTGFAPAKIPLDWLTALSAKRTTPS